ncbi:MAG: iron ABC transporter permease [Chloroflexi bacterium]|nr:MAG: iron ABC transporter permease [Chloroflexota bacterium]
MALLTRNRYALEFRRIFQDKPLTVGLLLMTAFVLIAIVWPILEMTSESLTAEGRELFGRYLGGGVYQTIIRQTLVMGLTVATGGTLLGFLFAFVQVKLDVPFKRLMHLVALFPIISPPFAVASAVLFLIGRNGRITKGIFNSRVITPGNDIYGLDGLSLVLILAYFTIAYLNLKGMMQALDPALDEAATDLGASKWRVFRTVTLPMLIPGFAGSFLLIFVESIADLGNPLTIGGNYDVLAVRVYLAVIGLNDFAAAAVLSVVLLVPSLTIFIIQRYWVSRRSVVSVTGKPTGTPQMITHPLVKWSLWGLTITITAIIIVIYVTIILGGFTRVPGVNNALTLEHFDFVINGLGSEAITDTTTLAAIATPIAGIIGMIIAFLVVRKQFFGRGALDFAAMLGLAVPGTVFGIGFLLAFNTPTAITIPFTDTQIDIFPKLVGNRSIFSGAAAIVIVYVVRSVPAALRVGVSSLTQIDPAIEEASINLGANSIRTFRSITLPLVRPAYLAGLIYAFARSMTSISAIVFLTTPRTKILTAQMLNEVQFGRFGNAFALSVILIVLVLGAIGVMYFTVGSSTGAERSLEGGV